MRCRTYSALRGDLLISVEKILKNERLRRADDKMMLRYLLGNTEIAPIVAKYLRKTMELREFLIDRPKQLN